MPERSPPIAWLFSRRRPRRSICSACKLENSEHQEAASSGTPDRREIGSPIKNTVPTCSGATERAALLASPQIGRLIIELGKTRSVRRPRQSVRTRVGMALAKSL